MSLRCGILRWLVRSLVRPGMAPGKPMAQRRQRTERTARLVPLPRSVQRVAAGGENPGGEWLLPPGTRPESLRGAVLYIHGGGFLLGSPATHRGVAAQLARLTRLPVLAAAYRLAPEHPYPAGLDDVQSAWRHITLEGARPVALAGDSAGAWLALAVALYAVATGLPKPTGMALFSPLVDLARAVADPPRVTDLLLPEGLVAEGIEAWRGSIPVSDPRFDLLAAPLAGLPPMFLSFDRDEMLAGDARRLAQAVEQAGVRVRTEERNGLWHAWPLFAGLLPEADATLRNAVAMLAPAGRAGIPD